MSFMMQIEATQRSPLDQLAVDYPSKRPLQPSIDFCRRVAGVPEDDEKVARRLSVTVSMVRGWRRRAIRWGCQ